MNIKDLIEIGFAANKIAQILKMEQSEVRQLIKEQNLSMKKEIFSNDKIPYIIDLYKQGVSAKQLGIKFSIDKRRVQKWAKEDGSLRDKATANRTTHFNQNAFDIIDSPGTAYWLGFFYADAYNCDMSSTFTVTLKGADFEHLEKLCDFVNLPREKVIRSFATINDNQYETATVKLYSKHICETMTKLGCPRAKSFIIKYPEWLPKELNKHFIRGLFDGDGSITKRATGEWKWSLVSTKECAESIQNIILSELNVALALDNISKTENNTYELETNGNQKVLTISKWLYDDSIEPLRLSRKYERVKNLEDQQNNRSFLKNKSIQRDSYNISDEEKAAIIEKIKNNISFAEIAKQHFIHRKTVSKINLKLKTMESQIRDGKS